MYDLPMDDEDPELRKLFIQTTVFAKLNPAQKARVVGVLRECGYVLGFLGDGINE